MWTPEPILAVIGFYLFAKWLGMLAALGLGLVVAWWMTP